mgnify:FL=1
MKRHIDKGFIEYETNLAFEKQAQQEETRESLHYLEQLRDDHARLDDPTGVNHYEQAIAEHLFMADLERFLK